MIKKVLFYSVCLMLVVSALWFGMKIHNQAEEWRNYKLVADYLSKNDVKTTFVWLDLKMAGFTNDEITRAAVHFIVIVSKIMEMQIDFQQPKNVSNYSLEKLEPILVKIKPFERMRKSILSTEDKIYKTENKEKVTELQEKLNKRLNKFNLIMATYKNREYSKDLAIITYILNPPNGSNDIIVKKDIIL